MEELLSGFSWVPRNGREELRTTQEHRIHVRHVQKASDSLETWSMSKLHFECFHTFLLQRFLDVLC